VRGALNSGMHEAQTRFFDNSDAAADFVTGELRKGDLVLVKGSRGVRAEKIVQSLRSHFELLN
jgi:UDP-N-acetylmuramoyl-tripeptide--D-alanyl-D-alanine ligase